MRLVELAERVGDRFQRALHVGLQHEVQRGDLAALHHREDVLETGATRQAHRVLQARGAAPIGTGFGDGPCGLLVGGDAQVVAGERDAVEPEYLDRNRRACFRDLLTVLVEQCAHLAPRAAGDDRVADTDGAALDEGGDHGPAAGIEVRLQHEGTRRCLRVRGELLDLGDEQDRLEQLVDTRSRGWRDVDDDGVAAPELGHELSFHELLAHARGVGVFAVDLGDGHDDRHLGRTAWLIASTVCGITPSSAATTRIAMSVARGTARAHGRERLVTRRVDERDRVAVVGSLVCADVLGDPAGFTSDDVCVADRVEQRCLAVVDVSHDGDDRHARLLERVVVFVVVAEQRLQLQLGFLAGLDEQDVGTE